MGIFSPRIAMLVSPLSLPLRCLLPCCWMALVTVQRSPTPSTSSSPCVSVRTSFIDFSTLPLARPRYQNIYLLDRTVYSLKFSVLLSADDGHKVPCLCYHCACVKCSRSKFLSIVSVSWLSYPFVIVIWLIFDGTMTRRSVITNTGSHCSHMSPFVDM